MCLYKNWGIARKTQASIFNYIEEMPQIHLHLVYHQTTDGMSRKREETTKNIKKKVLKKHRTSNNNVSFSIRHGS